MEAEAKHDFVPSDPETELAFKKGEKLLILNYGDAVQWYNAQKNGETGLVPGNYIEVRRAGWYLGRIPRSTAESMLKSSHDGAFLVRLSESSPNDFSLSVKCGDAVQHFRILKNKDHKYFLWTVKFDSLNELVENYKNESVSRTQQILLRDMDCGDETFTVQALYDFDPKDDAEEGETELGFKKGDMIQVFDCRDENWWGGRIGDRTGFFPKLYVEKQDLSLFKG